MGLFDNCPEDSLTNTPHMECLFMLDGEKTPILLQKEAIKLT